MSSPFQPLKAQATTGRPVKGLTSMPSMNAVEPAQTMTKAAGLPHPSMNKGNGQAFGTMTANKVAGAFTHETRGGSAPVGETQGIHMHDTVPHIKMHP
jgi:hypothetical protein